jgi:hypothetical protein
MCTTSLVDTSTADVTSTATAGISTAYAASESLLCYTHHTHQLIHTGARAKAWCLLICAEASLSITPVTPATPITPITPVYFATVRTMKL